MAIEPAYSHVRQQPQAEAPITAEPSTGGLVEARLRRLLVPNAEPALPAPEQVPAETAAMY